MERTLAIALGHSDGFCGSYLLVTGFEQRNLMVVLSRPKWRAYMPAKEVPLNGFETEEGKAISQET